MESPDTKQAVTCHLAAFLKFFNLNVWTVACMHASVSPRAFQESMTQASTILGLWSRFDDKRPRVPLSLSKTTLVNLSEQSHRNMPQFFKLAWKKSWLTFYWEIPWAALPCLHNIFEPLNKNQNLGVPWFGVKQVFSDRKRRVFTPSCFHEFHGSS